MSLINHFDRSIQYCSGPYQQVLYKNNVKCKMTQDSEPYENAVAERMNEILKQEFVIDQTGKGLDTIRKALKESINIYNQQRSHLSTIHSHPTKCTNRIRSK